MQKRKLQRPIVGSNATAQKGRSSLWWTLVGKRFDVDAVSPEIKTCIGVYLSGSNHTLRKWEDQENNNAGREVYMVIWSWTEGNHCQRCSVSFCLEFLTYQLMPWVKKIVNCTVSTSCIELKWLKSSYLSWSTQVDFCGESQTHALGFDVKCHYALDYYKRILKLSTTQLKHKSNQTLLFDSYTSLSNTQWLPHKKVSSSGTHNEKVSSCPSKQHSLPTHKKQMSKQSSN